MITRRCWNSISSQQVSAIGSSHIEQFTAMGCPCEIRVATHDAGLLAGCINEIRRYEATYSRYRPDSIVSRINAAAGGPRVVIDAETAAILDYANVCFDLSDGLFDITSGVLRRIWHNQITCLPAERDIQSALDLIGWHKVERTPGTVRLPEVGMQLDLGGVVKEYVADAMVARLGRAGVTSGLVNLGGDIAILGSQPDGAPWQIGIADPANPGSAVATITLADGAITTSGGYERFFEIDGERYSHLLDPRTGWPVKNLESVTVIAPQAVVAGSISTVALLKPSDEGLTWLEQSGAAYLAIDQTGQLAGNIAV